MLFGSDKTIRNILPHYKIDALVRIIDKHRYDDRLYIQTNLIEAYELLMGFVEKHLSDKFHLQLDQRVSLRTAIFREVVANIIVHREYTDARPCTFVITKTNVETENANNPHGEGMINPDHFAPFPKNPIIAKFFIQLGRVDELGSGVINVTQLLKQYDIGRQPEFVEGPTCKMKIPILSTHNEGVSEGVNDGVNEGVNENLGNKYGLKESEKPHLKQNVDIVILNEVINRLLHDGANDGRIDGVNEGLSAKITQIVSIVIENEGVQVTEIAAKLGKSKPTIERHMKKIKAINLLAFRGARKTGGYFITEYFENRLMKNH